MSPNITIRRFSREWFEDLVQLFDAYRQFYKQPPDLAGARKFLNERLENEESVIFLAFVANKPCGFVQLYPSFTSVGMARGWILNDLFVSPEARRLGAAEKLMEQAATFAKSTNAVWLKLETATDNTAARPLYDKCGYQEDRGTTFYTLRLK